MIHFIIPLIVARIYSTIVCISGSISREMILPLSRGFLSDLAVGMAAGIVVSPLARKKYTFFFIWALWVLAVSLNIEHIRVNSANMNYKFIHLALTGVFVKGSVLNISNLFTFIACAVFSGAFAAILLKIRIYPIKRRVQLAVSLFLLLLIVFMPTSAIYSNWTQRNFIEDNFRGHSENINSYLKSVEVNPKTLDEYFKQDLSGEQIISYPAAKQNVLLILVEGMDYDSVNAGKMPILERISKDGITYSNYISPQTQTNKGEYALLCGDYPNFMTREAKFDYIALFGPLRACLPEVLRRNGYKTVYMQSAKLSYMHKDKVMPRIGFDYVLGNDAFRDSYGRNAWGVDDRTLYREALLKVERFSESRAPWFMAVLTSGMHHPYNVPTIASPSHEQAIAYADKSLGEFIDSLKRRGVLENTLVLITSDESASASGAGLLMELSRNHAPLIALVPGVEGPVTSEGLFMHSDSMLSILDYLNIHDDTAIGRSIFRNYPSERNLIFGNVYSSKIYSLSREGEMYVCTQDMKCASYRNSNNRLFDPSYVKIKPDARYLEELKSVLLKNELNSDRISSDYVFSEKNTEYTGGRYLIGDHQLSARRGDRITWNFNIVAEDAFVLDISAVILDGRDVLDEKNLILRKKIVVDRGQTFSFEHSFDANADIGSIRTKAIIIPGEKDGKYVVEDVSIKRLRRGDGS